MILRPYQRECVDAISGALVTTDRFLVRAPTAAGKTLIFKEFLSMWERPYRKFLVVVNRSELVWQTYERFREGLKSVSVYSAAFREKDLSGSVIVASIQSLDRVVIPSLACIVMDEVHNFGNMQGRYGRLIDRHPDAKVVGFTATPWNNNKPIYGPDKFFKQIDFEVSLSQMIDGGYIVPPLLKAPPHQFDVSKLRSRLGEYMPEDVDLLTLNPAKVKDQVEDALPRLIGRKKILWVCASTRHANLLRQVLHAAGEAAAIMHSQLPGDMARREKDRFENTDSCRHMCCVMMATEGYDYPPIDAISFMRPTRSAVLFVQVIGRGLRLSPGKENCLVLDYGCVVENCGPLSDPQVVRYFESKKKEPIKQVMWICPKCFSYVERVHFVCGDCGHEKEPEKRDATKNLTRTAAFLLDISALTGPQDGTFDLKSVAIKQHRSKAGNTTIRIDHELEGRSTFSLYLTEKQWAFRWKVARELFDGVNSNFHAMLVNVRSGVSVPKRELPKSVTIFKNAKGFTQTSYGS